VAVDVRVPEPADSSAYGAAVDILRRAEVLWDTVGDPDAFPFALPAVRGLDGLGFPTPVTFLVGENGSGKSTVVEALAAVAGLSPEGGNRDIRVATRGTESPLADHLRLIFGTRPRSAFFLRSETFFHVAGVYAGLLGRGDLGARSHGEAVIDSVTSDLFTAGGLYLMDEPEAGLSFLGQLKLLRQAHQLVAGGSQLVAATHSPILLAFPGATIYQLDDDGIHPTAYEDTDAYQLTRSFLDAPDRFLAPLLED